MGNTFGKAFGKYDDNATIPLPEGVAGPPQIDVNGGLTKAQQENRALLGGNIDKVIQGLLGGNQNPQMPQGYNYQPYEVQPTQVAEWQPLPYQYQGISRKPKPAPWNR